MSELLDGKAQPIPESLIIKASENGHGRPPRAAELTLVIPTRNESENVRPLLELIRHSWSGREVDVLFVDDSDDGTPTEIEACISETAGDPLMIRLIARPPGRRDGGLSGAVIEAVRSTRTEWICVMDGDLQHPPVTVHSMIEHARRNELDLVVASRYTVGGSAAGLSKRSRGFVSRRCGAVVHQAFAHELGAISDPMSGFFLFRRTAVDVEVLRARGFKILLEIAVTHPQLRVGEVPFRFGVRQFGTSKASLGQGMSFARQVVRLRARTQPAAAEWLYDIHGLIGIESSHQLPELEKFLARRIQAAHVLRVRSGHLSHLPVGESLDLTADEPVVNYRERCGFAMSVRLGINDTDVTVSPFVTKSPHVLYTNVVEPILRWRLVELGVALVHAASFGADGDAFLVTARTDTGKTTTMLKVLDQSSLSFISDDLVLMSPSGLIQTYPKPLTISAHTVHALRRTNLSRSQRIALVPQSKVHSKEGRMFAFLLTKFDLPVASINAVTQRLIPPPKYHVEKLVRGVTSTDGGRVKGMFIIQRGGSGESPLDSEEALEILLSNCADAFGFPPYSSLERLLLAAADVDLRAREREIIQQAMSDVPVLLMRSDTLDWAERIPAAAERWDLERVAAEVEIQTTA